jgi:TctA family transporter
MTSEGNEKTIDAAKSTIRSATIGLVLVLTGFAIASFISSNLQRAVNKQQTNPPIEQPHG